jgi:hypothetical protein
MLTMIAAVLFTTWLSLAATQPKVPMQTYVYKMDGAPRQRIKGLENSLLHVEVLRDSCPAVPAFSSAAVAREIRPQAALNYDSVSRNPA